MNLLCKLFLLLILCSFPLKGMAHDPQTHQINALADAKSPLGGLCCNGKDYTIPSDWKRTNEGGYRVLIHGEWLDVPKGSEVTNMRNPDAEAKVWWYAAEGEIVIRCFMPGMEV